MSETLTQGAETPVAENAGKWGVSWGFPNVSSEGYFETREEAVRFIAEMPRESADTMHVLLGHSWFPDPEHFIDTILEQMEDAYWNEARFDGGDPYLADHITTNEEAFRADLQAALRAVFIKHLKPAEYWTEDSELSGDGAREELGEVIYE